MSRIEVQVPCTQCGHRFPLPLDQLQSGASTACPHRGRTGDKVRQALDRLDDQVKSVKVNLTVKRKS